MPSNSGAGEDLKSPLDSKKIKPVNPKGTQPWIFIGRTDAEFEALILWLPDANSRLIGKYPDAGKDWRQEGKGVTEDEMAGWHHRVDGHEFEQAPGVGDGQGGLSMGLQSPTWLIGWTTILWGSFPSSHHTTWNFSSELNILLFQRVCNTVVLSQVLTVFLNHKHYLNEKKNLCMKRYFLKKYKWIIDFSQC